MTWRTVSTWRQRLREALRRRRVIEVYVGSRVFPHEEPVGWVLRGGLLGWVLRRCGLAAWRVGPVVVLAQRGLWLRPGGASALLGRDVQGWVWRAAPVRALPWRHG